MKERAYIFLKSFQQWALKQKGFPDRLISFILDCGVEALLILCFISKHILKKSSSFPKPTMYFFPIKIQNPTCHLLLKSEEYTSSYYIFHFSSKQFSWWYDVKSLDLPHCSFCHREGNGTRSSTLAWKIPWTEEPGGLQSMGSKRVRHDWVTSLSLFSFMLWRRKWQPTPVFLPGESQGLGSLVGCPLWGCTESDTPEAT